MTSTEISPTGMSTQRLLSGLYVPADLTATTAPLDVVDRPQTRPEPEPTPEPKPKTEPAPVPPRPKPPAPAPTPVEVFRPVNPVPAPPPTPVVKPEPIKPPTKPGAEHFKMEKALGVGYWMSVAVGAIGQIVSFGGMIAPNMSEDMAWTAYLAAAMLAAFAEITMVGCGTAALKRRYNEGAWGALATIACLVCLYATALNAIHWYPVDPGMAIMFAGGSFLGFTAHFIAEHTAASDYEKALAKYREATGQPEQASAKSTKSAERKARPSTPKPQSTPKAPSKPQPKVKSKSKGSVATKEDAVRIGIEQGATTPAALKQALTAAGYALPKSQTTVENWCRSIREQRAQV